MHIPPFISFSVRTRWCDHWLPTKMSNILYWMKIGCIFLIHFVPNSLSIWKCHLFRKLSLHSEQTKSIQIFFYIYFIYKHFMHLIRNTIIDWFDANVVDCETLFPIERTAKPRFIYFLIFLFDHIWYKAELNPLIEFLVLMLRIIYPWFFGMKDLLQYF